MVYKGIRDTTGTAYVVKYQDGDRVRYQLPLGPSLKLRNHSPTGFEWGYGGSGPAQLALALLLDATGDKDKAVAHYQNFKFEKIAKLIRDEQWTITTEDITEWLRKEGEK